MTQDEINAVANNYGRTAFEECMEYGVCDHHDLADAFKDGYEQSTKDTLAEVEKWLKGNLHHLSCWNVDEFCISLRNHFSALIG